MRLLLLLMAATLFQGCIPIWWDGSVPARRMSLLVTDEAGQPLPQARLAARTQSLRTSKEGLPFTDQGTIDFLSPGYRYGGGALLCLGFIPIPPTSPKPPRERYQVMAEGYRPVRYDRVGFFTEPHRTIQEVTRLGDCTDSVEAWLYERTIVLKQK